MKKLYLSIFALFLITSCRSDFDINKEIAPQTDSQKAFEVEFSKIYGTVSPEITWMTVSSDTIYPDLSAIGAEAGCRIKIFTSDPRKNEDFCYMLADYPDVQNLQTLPFDHPIGLNKVFVSAVLANCSYTKAVTLADKEEHTVLLSEDGFEEMLPEIKPMSYLLCFEGFTEYDKEKAPLDFDYNDVVAEIEFVNGRKTAGIKVLAAGCECAAQLVFRKNGNQKKGDDEILFEEVHEALGFPGIYDYVEKRTVYYCLGTGSNSPLKYGSTTLDIENLKIPSITYLATMVFANFTIKAPKRKDDKTTSSFLPAAKGANYPQAILVADPTWKWVREKMLISVAHSPFRVWIKSPEERPFWYGGEMWKEANSVFAPPD